MTEAERTWLFKIYGLTEAQSRVVVELAHGSSNRQIADTLHVGIETVRSHLKKIYAQVDVHSRAATIVWAFRTGELRPDGEPANPDVEG